jgi:hypothetical protein
MPINMRKALPAFGLALVFVLGCAHGQDPQAAQACTWLDDDAARLSCYDAAMGMVKGAQPHPPKNLSAQVREVMLLPAGLYRLTLDNGQVWDTTEADSALAFKANDAVTISRRVLGGYEIFLAGHNTSVSATRKK